MIITHVLLSASFLQVVIVKKGSKYKHVLHATCIYSILLPSNLGNAFPSFHSFCCISEVAQRKLTKKDFTVSLTPFPELLLSQFIIKTDSKKW